MSTPHKLGPLPEPWQAMDFSAGSSVFVADQMRAYALAEVARAVEAERERCAKLCESIAKQYHDTGHGHAAERAANAIRAEGAR